MRRASEQRIVQVISSVIMACVKRVSDARWTRTALKVRFVIADVIAVSSDVETIVNVQTGRAVKISSVCLPPNAFKTVIAARISNA